MMKCDESSCSTTRSEVLKLEAKYRKELLDRRLKFVNQNCIETWTHLEAAQSFLKDKKKQLKVLKKAEYDLLGRDEGDEHIRESPQYRRLKRQMVQVKYDIQELKDFTAITKRKHKRSMGVGDRLHSFRYTGRYKDSLIPTKFRLPLSLTELVLFQSDSDPDWYKVMVSQMKREREEEKIHLTRQRVSDYYNAWGKGGRRGNLVKCQITGLVGDHAAVTVGRILPFDTEPNVMEALHMTTDLETDERNYLLASTSIREAFYTKQVSLVYTDEGSANTFRFKIWDRRVRYVPIHVGSSRVIGEFEDKLVRFPKNKLPLTRVMCAHTLYCFKEACEEGSGGVRRTLVPREFGSPLNPALGDEICIPTFTKVDESRTTMEEESPEPIGLALVGGE